MSLIDDAKVLPAVTCNVTKTYVSVIVPLSGGLPYVETKYRPNIQVSTGIKLPYIYKH